MQGISNNYENVIFIRDRRIQKKYKKAFEHIWTKTLEPFGSPNPSASSRTNQVNNRGAKVKPTLTVTPLPYLDQQTHIVSSTKTRRRSAKPKIVQTFSFRKRNQKQQKVTNVSPTSSTIQYTNKSSSAKRRLRRKKANKYRGGL